MLIILGEINMKNLFAKFIIMSFLFFGIFSVAGAQELPSISIGSTKAETDDNIIIWVSANLAENLSVSGLTFFIDFDSGDLEFLGFEQVEMPTNNSNWINNRIILLWYDFDGSNPLLLNNNDNLFGLNFKVISKDFKNSKIVFKTAILADSNAKKIPTSFINGRVAINSSQQNVASSPVAKPLPVASYGGRGRTVSDIDADVQDNQPKPSASNQLTQKNNSFEQVRPNIAPIGGESGGEDIVANILPRVLGEKVFAEGSLLRTPDKKIFIVQNGEKRHIKTLQELQKFVGREIINVSSQELNQVKSVASNTPTFADGSLLRDSSGRIYRVEDGFRYHIKSLDELRKNYAGKEIVNVDDLVISRLGLK